MKMKEKLIRFMQGRYGLDQLSKFLLVTGLTVVLLSAFFRETAVSMLFYILGWAIVIYCYFRVFSRNVSKRYAENQAYLMKTCKIRNWVQNQKNIWQQRKVYHIYTCPSCKQKIRIPKGKGKIEVRCPKCGATFIKKS
jgi:DNA-directed RNA polymerase subunit RPC12/RpoP